MDFRESFFSKALVHVIGAISIFAILQGCGSSSDGTCCQGEEEPTPVGKVSEVEKVVAVPEVKGTNIIYVDRNITNTEIVYVDRNVTIIEYVDRNITVIEYVDRNVTVDVIKVRPEAKISGLNDGAILEGDTLVIDSIESIDQDGNVTSYRWTLDDANISTERNPTIDLPAEEGTHQLCLEVTDNDNLSSKIVCKSFVIPHINENPIASISGLNDQVVKTKCPVFVSGEDSIKNDGEIVSYLWSIDDNQTFSGVDQNLSFDTLGEHEVCLTVVDSNDLNNTQCSTVDVQDHESPTAELTVIGEDGNSVTSTEISGDILIRGDRYDFTCDGSKDDCGNEEPMTCEWDVHSYLIVDGKKVDYVIDCLDHNGGDKIGSDSWVKLCGSPIDRYKYIEIELKITDQFGKSTTRTDVFEVAP